MRQHAPKRRKVLLQSFCSNAPSMAVIGYHGLFLITDYNVWFLESCVALRTHHGTALLHHRHHRPALHAHGAHHLGGAEKLSGL